jgi:hypothetical protein
MDHIAPLRSFEGGLGPFQFEVAGRSHDTMRCVSEEIHGHTLPSTSHLHGKQHQRRIKARDNRGHTATTRCKCPQALGLFITDIVQQVLRS